MNRFDSLLDRGTVLFDGAMGTELMARGVDGDSCLEELNLSQPALVRAIHHDYVAAGADVIETNTFGANWFRLGEHYLEAQVKEINQAGARLALEARNASGRQVLVAASVGPLGRPIEPIGSIKLSSAERIYREQLDALLGAGVDVIVFETFTALAELEIAVRIARELSPETPVLAQMSFDQDGLGGADGVAETVVRALQPLGVTAVGVNCGTGPQDALEAAQALISAGARNVSVMPNAGLPERVGGRLLYASGPDYFADYARRFKAAGIRIVGGCCGTNPQHVAAMRAALDDEIGPAAQAQAQAGRSHGAAAAARTAPPSRLAAQLADGRFAISVELTPPRGVDPRRMLEGARLLKEAGVDFANVTDSAMARLRMGAISCAALVQQQVGLEAIAHFTTRDRNVMAIQSELIGAHALRLRNLLCMRGDPLGIGDHPQAATVWEVNSVGLITIVANLNRGLDANGSPIGGGASFFIGAAVNPNAADQAREIRLLHRKLDAGAHFVVTQPMYDLRTLEAFLERSVSLPVPIMVGVMPLGSLRHAEYLHNEVPGIEVPAAALDRIAAAGEEASRVGLEMAVELLDGARSQVQGAYVIPFRGRYELAAQVVARSREMVG